jgi:LuxR family transcriptional regulator
MDIPRTLADLKEVAPAGFAVVLHLRFTAPTFLFQTYPKDWVDEYSRDGLLVRDPMVVWAFSNEGHVSWSDLAPRDEAGVLARAAAHGLRHGLAVSVERGGSRSMGGFARPDREFLPEEVARIEAALEQLHDDTATALPLPEAVRESLRRLSVAFTHP